MTLKMTSADCNQSPRAHYPGFVWPTVSSRSDNVILALQFQLGQTQWLSAGRIEAMQLMQLQSLVDHAVRNVPFHRRRLLPLIGGSAKSLSLETFRKFPILTRADVQSAGENLRSKVIPKGHGDIYMVQTSGSTGRPVTVFRTTLQGLFIQALNLRYHVWHQRDFGATVAGIRKRTASMLN